MYNDLNHIQSGIKHIEEFKYYYYLGSTRTLPKVAKDLGLNQKTVANWFRTERWSELVEMWDETIVEESRKQAVVEAVEVSRKYRNVVSKCIDLFLENLDKKKVKVLTVSDLDKLARLDLDIIEKLANGFVPEPKNGKGQDGNIKVSIDFVGVTDDESEENT